MPPDLSVVFAGAHIHDGQRLLDKRCEVQRGAHIGEQLERDIGIRMGLWCQVVLIFAQRTRLLQLLAQVLQEQRTAKTVLLLRVDCVAAGKLWDQADAVLHVTSQ